MRWFIFVNLFHYLASWFWLAGWRNSICVICIDSSIQSYVGSVRFSLVRLTVKLFQSYWSVNNKEHFKITSTDKITTDSRWASERGRESGATGARPCHTATMVWFWLINNNKINKYNDNIMIGIRNADLTEKESDTHTHKTIRKSFSEFQVAPITNVNHLTRSWFCWLAFVLCVAVVILLFILFLIVYVLLRVCFSHSFSHLAAASGGSSSSIFRFRFVLVFMQSTLWGEVNTKQMKTRYPRRNSLFAHTHTHGQLIFLFAFLRAKYFRSSSFLSLLLFKKTIPGKCTLHI